MVKTARQKDIADKLGVSRSLVTKVLNGNLGTTNVRPDTAKAILDMAKQLGYKPDPRALSLLSNRRGVIGAMVRRFGTPSSGLSDLLARGLCEEAERLGETLLVSFFNNETPGKCVDWLEEARHIDGLIIAGRAFKPTLEKLEQFDAVPTTIVIGEPPSERMSHVKVDGSRISYIATRHLIERGCRRIAHIYNTNDRLIGWRQALAEDSMAIDDDLIFWAYTHCYDQGVKAVRHFIASGIAFDGINAQSDAQAAGAINELMKLGIIVPDQVKVTGVDNAPFCGFLSCPISSVESNFLQAGKLGMRTLMAMIEEPDREPQHLEIEPILVKRKSTE